MQPSREERAAKDASEGARGGKKAGRRSGKAGGEAVLGAGPDHINALGLPNDGYDYEQHFKSMGVSRYDFPTMCLVRPG